MKTINRETWPAAACYEVACQCHRLFSGRLNGRAGETFWAGQGGTHDLKTFSGLLNINSIISTKKQKREFKAPVETLTYGDFEVDHRTVFC